MYVQVCVFVCVYVCNDANVVIVYMVASVTVSDSTLYYMLTVSRPCIFVMLLLCTCHNNYV